MNRLAALAIVLAAASFVEAQDQFPQPAALADNSGQDASKSGDAAAPSKADKPSKEELAKKALAEAEAKHKDAVESADQEMSKLEDYVAHLYDGLKAKDVAESIQQRAEKAAQSGVEDAEKAFRGHLSALSHAAAGASLDDLEDEALKATETVRQASRRQAHEMQKMMSKMQREKKSEARDLSRKAQRAASAALKAARALERAQRHAGVKEDVYEGTYGRAEDALERMRDHAGDLRDKAEEKVEAFFDHVEREVDRRSDSIDDGAVRHARGLRHEVGHAREQADAAAKRAAQAARAKEAAEAAAKRAGQAAPAEQARKDAKEPKAGDDAAPAKKDNTDASNPSKDDTVTLVSTESAAAVAPMLGFCAFCSAVAVAVSAGFVRRRNVRDAAPLLG